MLVVIIGQEQLMKQHAHFWSTKPEVDVRTFVFDKTFQVSEWSAFLQTLPRVDAIDVCVPHTEKKVLLAQLDNKQPVLVDLPLAESLEEEQACLQIIAEKQLKFFA